MNRDEALSIKDDLVTRGYNAQVVTFDDGQCGVAINTKAGPSVGIAKTELLEPGLQMVEQLS